LLFIGRRLKRRGFVTGLGADSLQAFKAVERPLLSLRLRASCPSRRKGSAEKLCARQLVT